MPEAHSEWSASKFKQIMLCPGSKVLTAGAPRKANVYSAEGTAAHSLLEMCLRTGRDAEAFRGRILQADGFEFEVDDDMIDHVQWAIDTVRDYLGDGTMLVEQQLHYHEYLDLPHGQAWGTGDVVILRDDEIIVIDLKYGRGVEVSAEANPQLMLYGLGAVHAHHGLAGDFERVRLVILQPRISRRPGEWDISREELEAWGRSTARSAVNTARNAHDTDHGEWNDTYLRPGEEQCRFCDAKATCPKLRDAVAESFDPFTLAPATPDEFAAMDISMPTEKDNDEWLAACMAKADLIEDWLKAVRGEVERRLLEGKAVRGYKLVQGKMGNRKWTDAKAAEEALKTMRLKVDEMYDMKLISPTTAEKVLADSPRRWAKLQQLITRSEGSPSVAPVTDPRPALEIKPAVDDFTVVGNFDDLA